MKLRNGCKHDFISTYILRKATTKKKKGWPTSTSMIRNANSLSTKQVVYSSNYFRALPCEENLDNLLVKFAVTLVQLWEGAAVPLFSTNLCAMPKKLDLIHLL